MPKSAWRQTPYAILGIAAICAETESEADRLAKSADLHFARRAVGVYGPLGLLTVLGTLSVGVVLSFAGLHWAFSTNLGGSRLDALLVRVPQQLLLDDQPCRSRRCAQGGT